MSSMKFSTLYEDALKVIKGSQTKVYYHWSLEFQTDNGLYSPMSLESVNVKSDFINSYADLIIVTVVIPPGDYYNHLAPYTKNLRARLIKREMSGSTVNKNDPGISTAFFKVMSFDGSNRVAEANSAKAHSAQTYNRDTLTRMTFQLVDPNVEQLRVLTMGGTIRGDKGTSLTMETLIKGMYTNSLSQIKPVVGCPTHGVKITPCDNKEYKAQIIIPHNQSLVSRQAEGVLGLAQWLQNKDRGVYNSGIGSYFKNGYWYIYPLYDTELFDKGKEHVVVINVSAGDMTGSDNTYAKIGNTVFVLATSKTRFMDRRDVDQSNMGNGTRFVDARKLWDHTKIVKGKDVVINPKSFMYEFVNDQKRDDGVNNVRFANSMSANPYAEMSKLAANNCNRVMVTWESSDATLIKPGMRVRFITQSNDGIAEKNGVVVGTETDIVQMYNLSGINPFREQTYLSLVVE